jgi:hypothetical protein
LISSVLQTFAKLVTRKTINKGNSKQIKLKELIDAFKAHPHRNYLDYTYIIFAIPESHEKIDEKILDIKILL